MIPTDASARANAVIISFASRQFAARPPYAAGIGSRRTPVVRSVVTRSSLGHPLMSSPTSARSAARTLGSFGKFDARDGVLGQSNVFSAFTRYLLRSALYRGSNTPVAEHRLRLVAVKVRPDRPNRSAPINRTMPDMGVASTSGGSRLRWHCKRARVTQVAIRWDRSSTALANCSLIVANCPETLPLVCTSPARTPSARPATLPVHAFPHYDTDPHTRDPTLPLMDLPGLQGRETPPEHV